MMAADPPPDVQVRPIEVFGDPPPGEVADVPGRARHPGLPSTAILVVGAALALGGASVGYLAGWRHGTAAPAASAAPSPAAPPPGGSSLAITDNRCSVQLGARLQLGVELVNRSDAAITLHPVQPRLPLGGLRATASAWGTCGQLPGTLGMGDQQLAGHATGWLTVTFEVLQACPAPLPVLFTVRSTQRGLPVVDELGGFNDLGEVPWTGCPTQALTGAPR